MFLIFSTRIFCCSQVRWQHIKYACFSCSIFVASYKQYPSSNTVILCVSIKLLWPLKWPLIWAKIIIPRTAWIHALGDFALVAIRCGAVCDRLHCRDKDIQRRTGARRSPETEHAVQGPSTTQRSLPTATYAKLTCACISLIHFIIYPDSK